LTNLQPAECRGNLFHRGYRGHARWNTKSSSWLPLISEAEQAFEEPATAPGLTLPLPLDKRHAMVILIIGVVSGPSPLISN